MRVCLSNVELYPGGANEDVTFNTRHKFADAVIQYRLHEIDAQCAAIREGLAAMVPIRPLTLFNWHELQTMVCGSPTVDVELLKVRWVLQRPACVACGCTG